MIQRDDLKHMRPETIVALRRDGDLDHLMRGQTDEERWTAEAEADAADAGGGDIDQGARSTQQPRTTRERLRQMTPQQIVEARRRGDLDPLLRGEVT
jgi:hypothetical protein